MALHTDTEVYAAIFDLLGAAVDAVREMRKDVKPVIGGRIIEACVQMDLRLRAANIAKDKEQDLMGLLEQIEIVELLTRMCRDWKFIPLGKYADLVQRTASIGKQVNGWRKAEKLRQPEQQQQLGLNPESPR